MGTFRDKLELLKKNNKIMAIESGDVKKIAQIQKYMNGNIPPSYDDFLNIVGHGLLTDGSGWIFNGTGKSDPPAIIYSTELYRQDESSKIPMNYLILSEIGAELLWCFDLNQRDKNNEYKIIGWVPGVELESQPDWARKEIYRSFKDFFEAKVGSLN